MGWHLDRVLRSQVGLVERLMLYRKPINSLKRDMAPAELNCVEELICGLGWAADTEMQRVPETDCLSVLVVTPSRIIIGAGELTEGLPYDAVRKCYWDGGDLCIRLADGVADVPGIRFEQRSGDWPAARRSGLVRLIMERITGSSPSAPRPAPASPGISSQRAATAGKSAGSHLPLEQKCRALFEDLLVFSEVSFASFEKTFPNLRGVLSHQKTLRMSEPGEEQDAELREVMRDLHDRLDAHLPTDWEYSFLVGSLCEAVRILVDGCTSEEARDRTGQQVSRAGEFLPDRIWEDVLQLDEFMHRLADDGLDASMSVSIWTFYRLADRMPRTQDEIRFADKIGQFVTATALSCARDHGLA